MGRHSGIIAQTHTESVAATATEDIYMVPGRLGSSNTNQGYRKIRLAQISVTSVNGTTRVEGVYIRAVDGSEEVLWLLSDLHYYFPYTLPSREYVRFDTVIENLQSLHFILHNTHGSNNDNAYITITYEPLL